MKPRTTALLLILWLSVFTARTVRDGKLKGINIDNIITPLMPYGNDFHGFGCQVSTSITSCPSLRSAGSQPMRRFTCVTLSTQKVDIRSLVKYEKQHVPVNAIMFITAKGFKICVSPEQRWVQAAIKKIDQKRSGKGK